MGFECPLRQTTADFLTSLTSPAERVVRKGFEGKTPFTPDEFAAVWQRSEDRAQLLREIDEFDQEFPLGGESLEKFKVSRKGRFSLFSSIGLGDRTNLVFSYTSQTTTCQIAVHSLHPDASRTLREARLSAVAW